MKEKEVLQTAGLMMTRRVAPETIVEYLTFAEPKIDKSSRRLTARTSPESSTPKATSARAGRQRAQSSPS